MKYFALVLSLAAIFAIPAQARPSYGGGHHTTSHGGHYNGGHGSSHKNGKYKNKKTDDQYGKHK